MKTLNKALLSILLLPFCFNLLATEAQDIATIKKQLKKNIPSINITSISQSPVAGLYEVLSSGQMLYVSSDGNYLISGKLFSIKNGVKDLTAESMRRIDMKVMAPLRRKQISDTKESDMIVFKANEEKYRITVFTDVDCTYCRKLHKEIPKYHTLGISVQYMGYPRAGLGSSSHKKLQTVWCASDRKEAMNNAKLNRTFGKDTCDDPLENHYKMVQAFGLSGTPAVILKSGRYISGFAYADDMLKTILEDEALLSSYNSGGK